MKEFTAVFDRGEMITNHSLKILCNEVTSKLRWDMHRKPNQICHVDLLDLDITITGIQTEYGRTIIWERCA